MSKKLTDLSVTSDLNGFELLTEEQALSDKECLKIFSYHQEKRGILDTDRCINEMRDGYAGRLIGFNYINKCKNGFDCANENGDKLEVKSINACAKSWGATFNDTTEEKALSFKNEKVYLQVPIWINAFKMSFFLINNNPKVGNFLLDKVKKYINNRNSFRCTQTLNVTKLYKEFGFKIVAVDETKEQVVNRLKEKYKKSFKDICEEDILTVDEYNEMKK